MTSLARFAIGSSDRDNLIFKFIFKFFALDVLATLLSLRKFLILDLTGIVIFSLIHFFAAEPPNLLLLRLQVYSKVFNSFFRLVISY